MDIQEKMSKRQADIRSRAPQSPQSGPKLGNHQHEDGMDSREKEYRNARSEWAFLQGPDLFRYFNFSDSMRPEKEKVHSGTCDEGETDKLGVRPHLPAHNLNRDGRPPFQPGVGQKALSVTSSLPPFSSPNIHGVLTVF